MNGVAAARTVQPQLARAWRLLQAGQLQEAEQAFRALLHDDPGSGEIWNGIGLVAYREKRYEQAERAFRKAVSIAPSLIGAKHHLGVALRALGRHDEALKLFDEIAPALGDEPQFLNNWGNALAAAGRIGEGADILARALALDPESDFLRVNLAKVLVLAKRPEEAVEVLSNGPGGPDKLAYANDLGNALVMMGRYAESVAALRRARDAGLAGGHELHNLGTALQFLGKMEEAEDAYRRAIAKNPELVTSRRHLTNIIKFKGSEHDLRELRAAIAQRDLSRDDRAEIYLGLAKALDDLGNYAEAFANLQAANQLVRISLGYTPERNAAYIDRTIETFTEDFLEARRAWGDSTRRPVFIVGMPRSGTTLVEQILCSHPDVHGAGELMTMFEIFRDLRQVFKPDLGMPRIASLISEEVTRSSAQRYLDHIGRLDGKARYVSDKMPFNYRYLGLISLLFPNAKIIHTARHPLDTGLSCYFARFSDMLDFSFNLAEIGWYYRDYQRVMNHWGNVIRNDRLTIDYDTLVHNQERETRRLLEFCELEWDDRCLEFHRTERAVSSASNWQVRQPLYATSSGRWRHYREQLRPMMAALELTDPEAWRADGMMRPLGEEREPRIPLGEELAHQREPRTP